MNQSILRDFEDINEKLQTYLLSDEDPNLFIPIVLSKISKLINCSQYGLVSRSDSTFLSIYGDPESCLDSGSYKSLNIFKVLIKNKKYMSWDASQRIEAGLTDVNTNLNEFLHYFPLAKGRKIMAFIIFRGAQLKEEYLTTIDQIVAYINLAYQLQAKQEDLSLMQTRFSLNKLLQDSAKIHNPAQLIALSCPIISKHFNAERTTFFAYNAVQNTLQSIHAEGLHEPIIVREYEGLVGSCLKSKKTFFTNHPYEKDEFSRSVDQITGFLTKSALMTPLILGEKVFGVLQVLNSGTQFNDLDLRDIQTISQTLSSHLNTFKFMRESLATQIELKSLLETIPEVLYRLDENGYFLFVSQEIIKWGYMREDLIGKHFKEIIYKDDFENVAREVVLPQYIGKTTGDKRSPGLFDERRSGKRGSKLLKVRIIPGPHINFSELYPKLPEDQPAFFFTEVNASGYWTKDISSNPKFDGTIGIISDITDKYFAEQKLKNTQKDLIRAERFAGLGTLAAGIAHDFNNILAAIGLSSEVVSAMLQKNESIDEILFNLKNISKYVNKASDLTDRLLTLGRSNISKFEPAKIEDVIDDVIGIMKHQLETRGIDVHVQILGNIPECLLDKGQLRDALINLTANSMHAIEEEVSQNSQSDIQMRFSIIVKQVNNDIVINVIDTGIGIDKSILPRIFDPFFTTKNRDYRKGTGLGLAMVFSVVKSHSGTIEIHTATREDLTSISKIENKKSQVLELEYQSLYPFNRPINQHLNQL